MLTKTASFCGIVATSGLEGKENYFDIRLPKKGTAVVFRFFFSVRNTNYFS
jgi:hypothetical protein